jgi:hypothetical protein
MICPRKICFCLVSGYDIIPENIDHAKKNFSKGNESKLYLIETYLICMNLQANFGISF